MPKVKVTAATAGPQALHNKDRLKRCLAIWVFSGPPTRDSASR